MKYRLGVANFKAFGDRLQKFEKKPITLIYGANSIGKSSLMHALLYLQYIREVGDVDMKRTEMFGDEIDLGGFDRIVHGRDPSNRIVYSFEIDDKETIQKILYRFFGIHLHPVCTPDVFETLSNVDEETLRKAIDDVFGSGEEIMTFEEFSDNENKNLYETLIDIESFYRQSIRKKALRERFAMNEFLKDSRRAYEAIVEAMYKYGKFASELSNLENIALRLEISRDDVNVLYELDGEWLLKGDNDQDEGEGFMFVTVNHGHTFVRMLKNLVEEANEKPLPEQRDTALVFGDYDEKLVYTKNSHFTRMIDKKIRDYKLDKLVYSEEDILSMEEAPFFFDWEKLEKKQNVWHLVSDSEGWWDFPENTIVTGLVALFSLEISDMFDLGKTRHIGPMRFYPRRSHMYENLDFQKKNVLNSEESWYYLRVNEDLRNEINRWLSKDSKLKTPYEISIRRLYELDENALREALHRIWNNDQDVMDPLEGMDYTEEMVFVDKRYDVALTNRDLGLGISQIVPVLIATKHYRNVAIMVEQPELHLHPAVQSEIADEFIRSHNSQGNEFVVETHSEHLLLRMMKRMRQTSEGTLEDENLHLTPEDVALLFVDSDGERTYLLELRLDRDGTLLDPWPGGFFEEGFKERFF